MSKSIADVELLKHCLQGHTQSFEVLVGRYQSLVCAITYGATGNVDMSEELAQETFLLAWKNLKQLKDPAKFKSWLCRIAMNVINNWRRSAQRDNAIQSASSESTTLDPTTSFAPDEVAIQKEQQVVVSQALECLPENYRLPLILFYRQDKSIREVADLIGLNENATRQRISRARGMLKEQVAAMVETTLSHSKPGKAFTTGVVASLAGLTMKNVTTASAAGLATTGLASLSLKITGIAAGIAILIGTTLLVQHHKNANPASPPSPDSLEVANATESNELALAPQNNPASEEDSRGVTQHDTSANQTQTGESQTTARLGNTAYVFKPQGVISGLITDAETGKPVHDATLRLSNNGIGHVQTDEHGFYHIDRIFSPGNQRLFIDSNDYVGFGLNAGAPTLNVSQDQQIVRHFQLTRACKVKVWVTDVNGIPIEKAEVIPTSLADNRKYEINDRGRPRRTDENGYLLLGGFPPSTSDYMITVIAKERVRETSRENGMIIAETQFTHAPAKALVRLEDPNTLYEAQIVMEEGETIHGYAEYNDGVPADDIWVNIEPTWWHCFSSIDLYPVNADGTFAIHHVLPGTYNIFTTTKTEEGYPKTTRTLMQETLPLPDNTPLFLPLPLPSPQSSALISGQVFFPKEKLRELESQPLIIAIETNSSSSKTQFQEMQLYPGDDYQGHRFTINQPTPGDYWLRFSGHNIESKKMKVTAPCQDLRIELDVTLDPRPQIEGVVADEANQQPIKQFQTRLRKLKSLRGGNSSPTKQWISFQSNEGYFSLDTVGPGIYQVQVQAEGYAPCWSESINTDEDQSVLIALSPGGALTGRIVDSAGHDVNDAKIIPLSWAGDINPSTEFLFDNENGATQSQAGVFVLNHLPEGIEAIKIVHPDYAEQVIRDIPIAAGQTAAIEDIVLTSGGTVEGVVFDEQGHPLPNQTLAFCDAMTGTSDNPAHRWATVVTDGNGFYQATHLPTRSCIVYRDNPYTQVGVKRRSVTPEEGKTLRLDFGGYYNVSGQLTGQDDFNQKRLVLRHALRANFECFTQTDEFGNFTFSGIVPGTYELAYEKSRGQRWKTVSSVTVEQKDLDLGLLNEASVDKPQTTQPIPISPDPTLRQLSLKLPLQQPKFHWTFMNQSDFLAGKLELTIERGTEQTGITVFENGEICKGWKAMPVPETPKAGEIYFGFQSTQQYQTAPDDHVTIELQVVRDLQGIGALQTGILPAGTYRAEGTYTLIMDEYQLPAALQQLPPEAVEKLKEMYNFKAFLESWESKWPLQITADEGWLESPQREQVLKMMEQLDNEN